MVKTIYLLEVDASLTTAVKRQLDVWRKSPFSIYSKCLKYSDAYSQFELYSIKSLHENIIWGVLLFSAQSLKSKIICAAASNKIVCLSSMKVIIDLAHDVFGPTIKFLTSECSSALMTDVGHSVAMVNKVIPGVQEVSAFIMMYSALLDKGYSRDEFEKKISSREPDGRL